MCLVKGNYTMVTYRYPALGVSKNYDTKMPKRGIIEEKNRLACQCQCKNAMRAQKPCDFEKKKAWKNLRFCALLLYRALMGKAKERSTSRIVTQSTAARVVDELNRIEKDYDSYFVYSLMQVKRLLL